MAPHFEPEVIVAVHTADISLQEHVFKCFKSERVKLRAVSDPAELESQVAQETTGVVLLGIGGAQKVNDAVNGDDFSSMMSLLARLRECNELCQAVLLVPCALTLEQSCQAVLAGVGAMINYRDSGFCKRLDEHVMALCSYWLEQEQRRCEEIEDRVGGGNGLVGVSVALRKVIEQAERAARVSDASVIIFGESGTGKQRIAEIIHELDEKRSNNAFVCVNCASISGTLAESELFGHRRGAFTGATGDRLGYFRAADGGTILLDEISELDLSLQPKILRVLQEGLVMPVGSDREHRVDVRVIAATNRDLRQMVCDGSFRLDLLQRLNVIYLRVPPLRQRMEDIPPLFEAFLKKYAHYCRHEVHEVDPRVYDILAQTLGGGNVRELENLVRRILAFKDHGCRIEIADLPQEMISASLRKRAAEARINISDDTIDALIGGSKTLADALEEYERAMLSRLVDHGINQTTLARRIGMTRRTLYNKLQRHKLR